jgi:hypothetical protein
MGEPVEVVFSRSEDGTVSRTAPEGPWPEHIHIAAELAEEATDDMLDRDFDVAGRVTALTFRLPNDEATYDLTPGSGLGEIVWVYEAQLRTADERVVRRSYCEVCKGAKWTGRGWIPHLPDCPRNPLNREPKERPQSTEEQDRERESLSELDAPFRCSPVRFPEGPSALSDFLHQPYERRKRKTW